MRFGVFLVLACLSSLLALPSIKQAKYCIVFDAGSSGTRVHVFKWFPLEEGLPQMVLPQPSLKQKPGLSSFAENPEDAGESLKELIRFANENVPPSEHSSTVLTLKATAGLRLLSEDKRKAILNSAWTYIKKHSPFKNSVDMVGMLGGKEEGAYAWLAANYLLGALKTQKNVNEGTAGVMDLGGGSTQITFETSDEEVPDEADDMLYRLELQGICTYELYSYSHLNFGQEAARRRVNEELEARITNGEVHDPCLPKGYTKEQGQRMSVYEGLEKARVIGAGDQQQCAELTKQLFDKQEMCPVAPCAFNGVFQPSLKGKRFIAIENWFYTSEFLGLVDRAGHDNISTVEEIETASKELCHDDFSNWAAKHPTEPANDLSKYCFSGTYLASLASTGFGYTRSDAPLIITKKVRGEDVDWALGQAIALGTQQHAAVSAGTSVPPSLVLLIPIGLLVWVAFRRRAHHRLVNSGVRSL